MEPHDERLELARRRFADLVRRGDLALIEEALARSLGNMVLSCEDAERRDELWRRYRAVSQAMAMIRDWAMEAEADE